MAGLIRQSLSQEGAGKASCVAPELLAAYYEHSLTPDEASRCEVHFATCSRCRQQLALMAQSEPTPEPVETKSWLWDWRVLVATAAVLIVVATVALQHAMRWNTTGQPQQPALLAQSEPNQSPAPNAEPPKTPVLIAPSQNTASAKQPDDATSKAKKQLSPVESIEQRATNSSQPPSSAIGASQSPPATTNLAPNARSDFDLRSANAASDATPKEAAPAAGAGAIVGGLNGPAAPAYAPSSQAPNAETAPAIAANLKSTARLAAPRVAGGSSGSERRNLSAPSAQSLTVAAAQSSTDLQRSDQILITTPDRKVLWRITGGNFVERSTDGGATWQGTQPDPSVQLTTGASPGGTVCWLVGRSGAILMTKDAIKWRKVPPPVPSDFTAVTAQSASAATITTSSGQKFSTTDAGKKWKPVQ